jgi:invasion protein IalB
MTFLPKIALIGIAALGISATAATADQQCWVGTAHGNQKDWTIACTQVYGTGSQILGQTGHPNVVYGPATWDQCNAWAQANIKK